VNTRLLLLLLLCFLVVPSFSFADTVAVCDTIPRTTFQDLTLVIDVPSFPYQDCTLMGAEVVLNVTVDGQFFGENTGNCLSGGCSYADSIYLSLSLQDLDGNPILIDENFTDSGLLTSYDGVFDFGGTSGYTTPFMWPAFNGFVMTYADLSIFNNPVPVVIDAEAFSQLISPGNGSFNVSTYIEATVCATYTYECTTAAEPVTWGQLKSLYK
jgi:hypothetical protein